MMCYVKQETTEIIMSFLALGKLFDITALDMLNWDYLPSVFQSNASVWWLNFRTSFQI